MKTNNIPSQKMAPFLASVPIWIIFLLGLYLIVLKRYGLHWELVPGDLGDGRFNNYILEHFYLWVKGTVPLSSYWDAPFFYPYKNVTAFSDNLLGAAPIYAFFRWVGASRETALQWWYLFSFILNYVVSVYVLSRAKLKPLAIGVGAFFFTFGIPVLALGGHFQLYYRFGIPLACFFLLEFFKQPKLIRLIAVGVWLVWQFYLSIYLGIFLVMLLSALALLAPFFETGISIQEKIYQWPRKIKQAWLEAGFKQRVFSIFIIILLFICFLVLILPYYKVSKDYGFSRDWSDISDMLPTFESFLLADSDPFWAPVSAYFGKSIEARYEHQLFPGVAMVVMLIIGLTIRFKSKNNQTFWLYFGAIISLIIATLSFNGYTLYRFIWQIPGFNSLRAIARIQMAWDWPLAFLAAWGMNQMLQMAAQKTSWLLYASGLLLTMLLIAESFFTPQSYYLKTDSILQITSIKNNLPVKIPQNPILVLRHSKKTTPAIIELNAMFAAQELGWPTLNGYSGNIPPNYIYIRTCPDIRFVIKNYIDTLHLEENASAKLYEQLIKRVVLVGFQDCGPNWQELPIED